MENIGTDAIYNYRRVDDWVSTGGQPTAEQLTSAAAEGFATVVNLATLNPRYSLDDEAGLVESLGMTYCHIPVEWDRPTEGDFAAFEEAMQHVAPGRTLIHCAANFRVTAFYSLFAMKHLGWTDAQAEEFRETIWRGSNYPIWERFIADMKTAILGRRRKDGGGAA